MRAAHAPLSLSRQSWRFNYYSNKVPVNDDGELLIVPGEFYHLALDWICKFSQSLIADFC